MRGWLRNSSPPAGASHEPGLAIIGCGKMGRLIEQLAPECGFDVRAKFTRQTTSMWLGSRANHCAGWTSLSNSPRPMPRPTICAALLSLGINAICGTTGWFEHLPAIREATSAAGTALVYSPNFSIGVNVFFQTVARAASFFAKYPEYEAWGWEIHHSTKRMRLPARSETCGRNPRLRLWPHSHAHGQSRRSASRYARNWFLIPPATPSRCATRRAAVKALPAERCRRALGRRQARCIRISRDPR